MSEFAGTLSERITVERAVTARTAMGLKEAGWEVVCRALAAVTPDGTGPEAEAMSLSAMARFRVTMRVRDRIAVDQRVRWGERVLMVRQLLTDPRRKDRIVLRCEEVRA